MHLLRLAGNFCCISELFLRPLKISLLCFRAIINHFNPKIESYAAVNHISQLSEDQVSQACQVFSHVDLWNVDVQKYLVLLGTDDVAAVGDASGTLMFLVQMRVRERKAGIALANFTTT